MKLFSVFWSFFEANSPSELTEKKITRAVFAVGHCIKTFDPTGPLSDQMLYLLWFRKIEHWNWIEFDLKLERRDCYNKNSFFSSDPLIVFAVSERVVKYSSKIEGSSSL
jgi:hypothetical protein